MANAVLQKYQKHTIYYASQRNASVDFYIPERDIAIVLCPNDELIPEAVQNLQRFDRKQSYNIQIHQYCRKNFRFTSSGHFQYISALSGVRHYNFCNKKLIKISLFAETSLFVRQPPVI